MEKSDKLYPDEHSIYEPAFDKLAEAHTKSYAAIKIKEKEKELLKTANGELYIESCNLDESDVEKMNEIEKKRERIVTRIKELTDEIEQLKRLAEGQNEAALNFTKMDAEDRKRMDTPHRKLFVGIDEKNPEETTH